MRRASANDPGEMHDVTSGGTRLPSGVVTLVARIVAKDG
ncbi:hypothetical protein BSLA_02f0667 [Burkholderia stabilis]|nr:hypothetical protein BSLA_02f0667 [Burkholderia stabilis]